MMKNQQAELSMLGTPLNEDVLSQVTGGNPFTPDQERIIHDMAGDMLHQSQTYAGDVAKHSGSSITARGVSSGVAGLVNFGGFALGQALVKKLKGH